MRRLRLTVQQFGFIPASRIAGGVLAVIAMLMPAMIQAQSSSASATLQGAVRDSKARPVAGATVYLQVKDGAADRVRTLRRGGKLPLFRAS